MTKKIFSFLLKRKFGGFIIQEVKKNVSLITREIRNELDAIKIQNGKVLTRQLMTLTHEIKTICDAEFQVFSQWGDDGIIQYLIHKTHISNNSFIEFGVENYRESNTRFLLINNNWKGLVLDGDKQNIDFICQDAIYWKHDLKAKCAFITRENVNSYFSEAGFIGPIGLLSIDIDGNDYWIWEATNVIQPTIVIIEYNSIYGSKYAVTIPYNPSFNRGKAHYSNRYWGCSLTALFLLGKEKGYSLVGCNSAGNNAYFVKTEKLRGLRELTVEEAFIECKYRESRTEGGHLSFLTKEDTLALLGEMPVFDTTNRCLIKIKQLSSDQSAHCDI